MAQLRIYHPIANEEDKTILSDWFGEDSICYTDIVDFLDSMDEDDNKVDLLIHCPGGDCVEGWAMYDKLRHCGKEITAIIEGECSSMATILLLSAPADKRFGFENARMCIHNPAVMYPDLGCPDRLTADAIGEMQTKLTAQQAGLIEEQNKILDLYVERTGSDRQVLQDLMNEDKYVYMDKAKELGFISSTVAPNTALKARTKNINKKKKTMEDKKVTVASKFLDKALRALGLQKIEDVATLTLNQKITAADGSEFTVEREDGDPQVGDKAYPNGTYTLDDGTVVVVEDEIITSITPPEGGEGEGGENGEGGEPAASTDGDKDKQIADLTQQVNDLTAQVNDLTAKVNDLTTENESLKSENSSLKAEKEDLTKDQKSEEDKAILEAVDKAGGKAWLDTVSKMTSSFHPNKRQFVPSGQKGGAGDGMTKTQRMLAKARENNEAKRAALKK